MRKEVILALFGFLIGAATLAGSDDESELRDELARLQREAARAMHQEWESKGLPPADGAGNQIGFFPIEDLTRVRRDVIPPSHLQVFEDSEYPVFGGYAEEGVLPFGTGEEILEQIRMSVDPESWESGIIALTGNKLAVVTRPATVGRVRAFLDRTLRPLAHRGIAMDFEVVEMPAAMLRKLRETSGGQLDAAARARLDEAITVGSAKRVFGLRGMGTLGTRFVVWHGREVAVVSDYDVEVAQTASTADPVVTIVQAGGYIWTLAQVDNTGKQIALDLGLRLEQLEGIRRHETRRSGVLDLPDRADQQLRVAMRVPNGQWSIAGSGTPQPGVHRLFLVRASLLERGGVR